MGMGSARPKHRQCAAEPVPDFEETTAHKSQFGSTPNVHHCRKITPLKITGCLASADAHTSMPLNNLALRRAEYAPYLFVSPSSELVWM